ncbi:LytTR family DNA-binding domain-containing protein [Spirosoma luteolum]
MMISCIILDDEKMAIDHLSKYIGKVPFLALMGSFTDPLEALRYLETTAVDLVFLDIEMPNYAVDGMDVVRIMGEKHRYIFTTAYPQYALPSYDYNAIDFLHKPFSFDRFVKAVQKARQLIINAVEPPSESADEDAIFVKSEGRLQRIDYGKICWIESERNYVSIFTDNDRITVLMSIGDMDQQLPTKRFARVHKSFIVSYSKIVVVGRDQVQIRRDASCKWIPMGEQFKKAFVETIDKQTLKKQQASDQND